MASRVVKGAWTRGSILILGFAINIGGIILTTCPALAKAPPVRIAVVPGGGSGMEQDVVDQITGQLQGMEDVALSTVNPDWYVVCNIRENIDQMSGQVRYNGNFLIKTVGGKVLKTAAVQKYNQDFSTSPGAPLNKTLVDRAAREVINNLANRAVEPLQQLVMVEMEGRNRVGSAIELDGEKKFAEALALIEQITPDYADFASVQKLHAKIVKDKRDYEAKLAAAKHSGGAVKKKTPPTK